MRCAATVSAHSLEIRSRYSSTDPQCQREAVKDGLCSQHYWSAYRRATTASLEAARIRREHRRIVNRILEIPPRP